MSLKRNRLDAGYELEPRVMLSGSIPGAEAPVSSESEAPVEEAAADEAVAAEDAVTEEAVAEEAPVDEAPADEAVAAEDTATEDAAAEEAPVEEAVAEESSEEVAPTEEVVAEDEAAPVAAEEEIVAEDEVAPVAVEEEVVAEDEVAPAVSEDEAAPVVTAEEAVSDVPEDGVVIGEGVSGVAINNAAGESITAAETAVEINGDATVNNAGEIAGGVNGVDFTETGTGTLNNTGVVSSDSRAVQINGDGVEVNNQGAIVGTDDQRNGTVYSDRSADDFTINNDGLIDAGEGNEGAGVSTELVAEGTTFDVNNNGLIQGRGDAAAGAATAGDGIRLERTRVDGALDGTTTGLFDGTINNNGTIDSEGENGTVAGFRAVNGVDFQGQLNNNGTISGTQNGVYFGNETPAGGGNNVGGVVNNNGTISSDSRAFNIDGTGLEVNNNGEIIGTDDQRNGTVYADETAQDFTLNNNGLIDAGEGNDGAGFSAELAEEGNTFEINNNGVLLGRGDAAAGETTAGDGVRLERSRVDGALDGTTTGLFDGTINNNGTIVSEGANGTVAGFRAVNGVDFQGELNNNGTIAGTQNGVYFGNETPAGGGNNVGGVVNNNGTISSDSRAFNIDGTGLEVNNNRDIVGTDDQRNGTVYADSTAQDFTLNNNGRIDAGEGNDGAGFSAELAEEGNTFEINNNGLLLGRGDAAAGATTAGDGIRLERSRVDGALDGTTTGLFDGTINNNGLIDSEGANGTVAGFRAVNGVDFQGELNNTGTISGTQNGVYFGNETPAGGGNNVGGVVNNSGTISSDSRAFNIDGTGLEVNNSGQIIGTDDQRNGTVYADETAQDFTLNNGGLVDAGEGNDGAAFSVELAEEGNTFEINNDGLLQGRGDAAAGATTAGDGIRLERTRVDGALDGTTTGLFDGTINNNGLVDSEGANGTVAGFRAVNGVDFQGELNNTGTISGTQNGVYFGNETPAGGGNNVGGVVNNSGTISSDSRAFNIDGTGLEVNNTGQIIGTDDQRNGTVYADSTAQDFTLNNEGLIDAGAGLDGAAFSVELSETGNDFTIDNSGAIVGRGDAAAGLTSAGDGIRLERTRVDGALDGSTTGLFTGTIDNSGLVSSEGANGTVGGFRAVNGVDFQGTLENSGAITGVQNGVYFGTGDHTGGVVNNSGVISSDSRSVNIDGEGLVFNNSGLVEATDRQRNGTVYADGTADNFEINNSGRIDARSGAGSGVSVQVGSEAGDVQSASITNSGEIFGAGDTELDAGVRLFNSAEGATTFDGDIVNSGTISSESAAAVLVEDGVQFDGDLVNSGVIDGEIDLSSGDVVLTDESVVYLDIAGVDQVEQIDTEGDVTFGGTLNVRFDEGFVPEAGQSFDLIDFGASSGSFTSVQSDQVQFDTSNLSIDGTVVVIGGVEVEVGEDAAAEIAAAADAGALAEVDAEVAAEIAAAVETEAVADAGVAAEADAEVAAAAETEVAATAEAAPESSRREARQEARNVRRESRESRRESRDSRRESRREARQARRTSFADFSSRTVSTY